MNRPLTSRTAEPRRGIVLLVVLVMLTLFAILGLTFVFFADTEANSSRTFREAQDQGQPPDVDPEQAAALFFSQFLFDVPDDSGLYSAMRGHGLIRNMYGLNYTLNANGTITLNGNDVPFNGVGRLHDTYSPNFPISWLQNQDDYFLVNYMYFPDDLILRDPEHRNYNPTTNRPWRTAPGPANNPDNRGPFIGGANVSYTYPDINNMFLAAVRADGTVLLPSFFRSSTEFPSLDPTNPNWLVPSVVTAANPNAPLLKYKVLRPRPIDHYWNGANDPHNFPLPEDAGGDVKNLNGGPASVVGTVSYNNDSFWMDLGAPVITLADGRKAKMLFAPLILPLDNRLNINAHGNIVGNTNNVNQPVQHFSNQGWGPWEVNLYGVTVPPVTLTNANGTTTTYPGINPVFANPNEYKQLYQGYRKPNNTIAIAGKYGANYWPSGAGTALTGALPHEYAQVDWDAHISNTLKPSLAYQVSPGAAAPLVPSCFPNYFNPNLVANNGWDNGRNANPHNEQLHHPSQYDVFKGPNYAIDPATGIPNDDRVFAPSDMVALLRYGDTGSEFLTSDLLALCPTTFTNIRARNLVTTLSMDRTFPGASPWIWNQYLSDNRNLFADPQAFYTQAPTGGAIPFPPLNYRVFPPRVIPPRNPPVGTPDSPNRWPNWPNFAPFTTTLFPSPSEFRPNDWRGGSATEQWQYNVNTGAWQLAAASALERIDLNRALTPYPLAPFVNGKEGAQTAASYFRRFDDPANPFYDTTRFTSALQQYQRAQLDRQILANDIYRRLLAVSGLVPLKPGNAAGQANNPTDAQLAPRRWLAQLAVNIVDFIDEDDISTPFNFYNTADGLAAANIGTLTPGLGNGTPEYNVPRYWVFGTELPHVVLNEVLAQTPNLSPPPGPGAPPPNWAATVKLWIELYNPFQTLPTGQPLQTQDGLPVRLNIPAVGNSPRYTPYRVVVFQGPPIQNFGNTNVLGSFVTGSALRTATTDAELTANAGLVGGGGQGAPTPSIPAQGFFLLAPTAPVGANFRDPLTAPTTAPAATPLRRLASMTYTTNFVATPINDERATGLTVCLRRLANPHLPFDGNPTSATYNPFVTVDYIDSVPLQDVSTPTNTIYSRSKMQPFGAYTQVSRGANGNPITVQAGSQVVDTMTAANAQQVVHTFGQLNLPVPPGHTNASGNYYDWLVHLDRTLISPMELLQVSGYQPYQLTQQFVSPTYFTFSPGGVAAGPNQTVTPAAMSGVNYVTGSTWSIGQAPNTSVVVDVGANQEVVGVTANGNSFTANFTKPHAAGFPIFAAGATGVAYHNQRVPWFDQTTRLYRFFEYVYTRSRATGNISSYPGGRTAGQVNLNNIWDPEVLLALCDPQNSNHFNATDLYKPLNVNLVADPLNQLDDPRNPTSLYWRLMKSRFNVADLRTVADGNGNIIRAPSGTDRPFQSLAIGYRAQNDTQYPQGSGIGDTYLRPTPGGTQPLFLPNSQSAAGTHPYLQDELLTKIYNNLTPRSNVFGVWVTVGLFEVTDGQVTNTLQAARVGQRTIRLRALNGVINNVPWLIHVGSHLVFEPGTANEETVTVLAITANTITARFTKNHNVGAPVGFRACLGAEIGRAQNRQIRHRFFAIIDRTNLNSFTTSTTTPVTANPNGTAPGVGTIQFPTTGTMANGQQWALQGSTLVANPAYVIQPGSVLEIDPGTANAETITVLAVPQPMPPLTPTNQPNSITANFRNAHAANAVIVGHTNPGPWPMFGPHSDRNLVPYFALID